MSVIARRTAATLGAAVAAAVVISACTSSGHKAGPALPSSQPPSSPVVNSPVPASSSGPPAAVLPPDCPHLLPLGAVQQAVGKPLFGQVTYLRAAPVPKSGRTGRVTCGYGTASGPPAAGTASSTATPSGSPSPAAKPLIEASYITYVDATTAKDRVALTVQTDGASSTVTKVDVNGNQAAVLTGPQWSELLMSDGARTIVVVAQPSILPAPKAAAALIAMAKVMLSFGAPAASQAASPSAAAS
jgi:hypothetical protein